MRVELSVMVALVCACVAPSSDGEGGGSTTQFSSSSDGTEATGTTTGTTAGSESAGDSSTETSAEDGGGDGDGDDGDACMVPVKLDLPPDPDSAVPDNCTAEALDWADLADYPDCVMCNDSIGCAHQPYLACVELGPGQTCAELCPSGNCAGFDWSQCAGDLDGWGDEPVDWCGHYEIDGRCCTVGKIWLYCAE